MSDREVTLEMIHDKLLELHEDVKAMRAEYGAILAMLREMEIRRSDEPRRVH